MGNTLKKLFFVSRPISWPNTAFPFATGYLCSGGTDLWFIILGTLYFLGPYNLLLYGVNDVFDYESDIKNPRKGGIEGMREERAFHPSILCGAMISNLPFLFALIILGNPLSNLILALVVFFNVAYSVSGLRFKEKPFLDSLTSSLHFVGPLVYALSLTSSLNLAILPILIAFFLWGMASHAFGAVQDILPDRAGKLSSIATWLGARKTVWFALILYLAAAILTAISTPYFGILGLVGLLYVGNIIPFVRVTDETSGITNQAWRRFIWLNLIAGFFVTLELIFVFVI